MHTVERIPSRSSQTASPLRTARAESHAQSAAPVAMGNQALQRLLIQAKLTVNQPGDRFELEADRVADTVMRLSDPIAGTAPAIQRMCSDCDQEAHRGESASAQPTQSGIQIPQGGGP